MELNYIKVSDYLLPNLQWKIKLVRKLTSMEI